MRADGIRRDAADAVFNEFIILGRAAAACAVGIILNIANKLIVFLRNVMIYFDEKTKKELIQKVYDVMEPGGYLFIGRTETIERDIVPFQLIQPSIFRKQEGKR